MMARIRGRRVLLLITGALPLLAEDDITPVVVVVQDHHHPKTNNHNNHLNHQARTDSHATATKTTISNNNNNNNNKKINEDKDKPSQPQEDQNLQQQYQDVDLFDGNNNWTPKLLTSTRLDDSDFNFQHWNWNDYNNDNNNNNDYAFSSSSFLWNSSPSFSSSKSNTNDSTDNNDWLLLQSCGGVPFRYPHDGQQQQQQQQQRETRDTTTPAINNNNNNNNWSLTVEYKPSSVVTNDNEPKFTGNNNSIRTQQQDTEKESEQQNFLDNNRSEEEIGRTSVEEGRGRNPTIEMKASTDTQGINNTKNNPPILLNVVGMNQTNEKLTSTTEGERKKMLVGGKGGGEKSIDPDSSISSSSDPTQKDPSPSTTATTTTTTTSTTTLTPPAATVTTKRVVEVDYASKAAGALILEQSNNFQGTSNLLVKDMDRYAIVPCEEPSKFVVIGLSEDILVKTIVLANYERYSSHTKDFNVAGRSTTVGEWIDLGNYTAKPLMNQQAFPLTTPTWARYLKIQFLTHYGNEDYCTMSQISVHGSTMLQGFHEQWVVDNENDQKNNINNNNNNNHNDYNNKNEGDNYNDSFHTNDMQQELESNTRKHTLEVMNGNDENSVHILEAFRDGKISHDRGVEDDMCDTNCVISTVFDFCPGECFMDFERDILLWTKEFDIHKNKSDNVPFGTASSSSFVSITIDSNNNNNSNNNNSKDGKHNNREIPEKECDNTLPSNNSIVNSTVEENEENRKRDDSPDVVQRIKTLIRNTAGAVDEFGNNLRQRGSSAATTSAERTEGSHRNPSPAPPVLSEESKETNKLQEAKLRNQPPTPAGVVGDVDNLSASIKTEPKQVTAADEKKPSPEKAGTPTAGDAAEVVGGKEDSSWRESNTNLALVLKKFPSAKCLEKLNFGKFKSDMLASRTGGGGSSGSPTSSSNMEPIFKKLTDEIKALQANMSVHDQFTKTAVLCYQSIILDLVVEMETIRKEQDIRLSKLENSFQAGAWICSLFDNTNFLPLVQKGLTLTVKPLLSGMWSIMGRMVSTTVTVTTFVIFDRQSMISVCIRWFMGIFLCLFVLYKLGLRIVWTTSSSVVDDNSMSLISSDSFDEINNNDINTPQKRKLKRHNNKTNSRIRAKSFDLSSKKSMTPYIHHYQGTPNFVHTTTTTTLHANPKS